MKLRRTMGRYRWMIICLVLASPSAMSGQTVSAPDIRSLMAQLNDVRTIGPDTAQQILEVSREDPGAREYVVQRLPEMIKCETNESWLIGQRCNTQCHAVRFPPRYTLQVGP
jgi:hypothetical protein